MSNLICRRSCICRVVALLLAGLLAGCATHKIDWAARVGHFTFDQAVLEYGPPDKQAKLTDGTLVAEWITRRGYPQTYIAYGYGYPPWFYGPVYPAYMETYSPEYSLRLIFDPDGQLRAWKKFAR
jgi:hypothetical protein